MEWKNVYLFISSTFNDMHAERDYLIKRVFPELRIWCSRRRLKLLDIDLRWGVSEADAQENKRVVDVCMQNIDKCRPFFLCLMGQRRGWVPGLEDVNQETLKNFPGLVSYLGKNSITELEVIHALEHPLDETSRNVRYAFFCFRDPSYLQDIRQDAVRHLFSPDGGDALEYFKHHISEKYHAVTYQADWDENAVSPELKNIGGEDLSCGRLERFRVKDKSLGEVILSQLKQAISLEFPDHMELCEPKDALEEEQNMQAATLFQACESYIVREEEEKKIREYLNGTDSVPYVICAESGNGKTSLLAHIIQSYTGPGKILYRFVGTSGESMDMERTFELLTEELFRKGLIPEKAYRDASGDYAGHLMELLEKAAKQEKINLILDGIDQWTRADQNMIWLSSSIPENVRLVISIRKGASSTLEKRLLDLMIPGQELPGMMDPEDKRKMIRYYLGQFLKDVDEKQLEKITELPGSSNPLYLKIVLNELRMFGSFELLWEQLNKNYGDTPEQAFKQILVRLEKETYSEHIGGLQLTKTVLAMLACSREGIRIRELVPVFYREGYNQFPEEEILDDIYALVHHLEPYLVIDGETVDFRYDSFRRAAKQRYAFFIKKRKWNGYLAEIYENRCRKMEHPEHEPDFRRNLVLLGYHALNSTADISDRYFRNAEYLYCLLKEAGVQVTAEYLEKADRTGTGHPHMQKISDLIRREAAQLAVNAGLLFYFMDTQMEEYNPVAEELISQAAEKLDCSYLRPVKPPAGNRRDKFGPYRETVFPDDEISRNVFVSAKYLVYVMTQSYEARQRGERDSVCLKNLTDEQDIFTFYVPGDIMRCYVDEDYLYLRYRKYSVEGERDCFDVFTLPQFNLVSSIQEVPSAVQEYSEGETVDQKTQFWGYKGKWYVLSTNPKKGFRVYRLSDGVMLSERVFQQEDIRYDKDGKPSNLNYEIQGQFLQEHFYADSTNIIWNLFSGEKIECAVDQTVSFTADENTLYIFERSREEFIARIYDVHGNHIVFQKEKVLPKRVGGSYSMVSGEFLLLFGLLHDLTILNRDLEILGYSQMGLGGHPQLKRVYLQGRDILYIKKDRIQRFRRQDLIGRLEEKLDYANVSLSKEILEYKDKIYSMAPATIVIDMKTCKLTRLQCEEIYQYHNFGSAATEPVFCKMGEIDALSGFAMADQEEQATEEFKTYVAAVQRLDTMRTVLRFPFTLPADQFVEGVGYHDLAVGIVSSQMLFWNRQISLSDPTEWSPENKSTFYKVNFHSYRIGLDSAEPVKTGEIVITASDCKFITIPDVGSYLFARGVYVDPCQRAIQVYNMNGEIILSRNYGNNCYVSDHVAPVGGHSFYCMKRISDPTCPQGKDRWQNMLVEIDMERKEVFEYPIGYDNLDVPHIAGINRDEMILETGRMDQSFHIFNLHEKKIVRTIRTNCSGRISGVIHKQGCYLCHPLNHAIWQVYSERGDYLFSQLMPGDIDYYCGDEGNLCIVEHENFSKREPVFYCIGNIAELRS